MNSDINLVDTTVITGNKILDLNGKTVTVAEDRALTLGEGASLTLKNGTIEYAGEDAPIYANSGNAEIVIDDAIINYTNTAPANSFGYASAIYVNGGSNTTVTMNGGEINVDGGENGAIAIKVYGSPSSSTGHVLNFNGGTINMTATGGEIIALESTSTCYLNVNGGTINMNGSAEDGWAFNVGQRNPATVVTSTGETVINFGNAGYALYDTDDAAQFEGLTFVTNYIN